MKTVTASDYTVELKISEPNYRAWFNDVYKGPSGDFQNGVAPAMSFKKHLKGVIESQLTSAVESNYLNKRDQLTMAELIAFEAYNSRTDMLKEVKIADI
jgi:hypothetical protein